MTGTQRREQLLDISRKLFAEKGFENTSVEEIAARAEVSKPVVYEHFGGKEGIYAVVVDREIHALLAALSGALEGGGHPKILVERTAMALHGASVEAMVGTMTMRAPFSTAASLAVSAVLPPPMPTTTSAPILPTRRVTRSISSAQHSPSRASPHSRPPRRRPTLTGPA